MSKSLDDPSELSNRELLERAADLDEDKFPIAKHAERGLSQLEDSS